MSECQSVMIMCSYIKLRINERMECQTFAVNRQFNYNWNVSQEKNQACTESEPMHDIRVMQAMLYQHHGYDGDQLSFHT